MYQLATATPGLKGFDCNTKLSTEKCNQLYSAGYKFCVRYLSRLKNESSSDLTQQEVEAIMASNLALSAVQHVQVAGWQPSSNLGTEYGRHAAQHATQVGLVKGMNIWLDLEGIASDATEENVIAYCQSWLTEVQSGGYAPGLYVGANSILTSSELYYKLSFKHYWKSLSRVPTVAQRGFQMIQSDTKSVCGIEIDEDTTQSDNLGGNVIWMVNDKS